MTSWMVPRRVLLGCLLSFCMAAGLQLPQAAAVPPFCNRCVSPVLLAKKKAGKSKVAKAADKALAALEALESQTFDVADGMVPAAPEPVKKKAKKAKAATAALEADPFAVPFPDGMTPAAPEPLKKKNKKGAVAAPDVAATVAPPPPAAAAPTLTMADKVKLVEAELGLEAGLPIAMSVKAANEAMGLDGEGPLAQQVQALMTELGIAEESAAPSALTEEVEVVAAEALAAAERADVTLAEEAPEVEEPAAEAAAGAEAVAEPKAAQEVTLSKKKQGKKKKAGEVPGTDADFDQSGRRAMGSKRIETFADAAPGFAYVRLSDGKLRFRTQEVLCGVNWDVQTGQRVGLVGNNGAGKTTQLRVLAEELELDEGELVKSSPDIKVAFLRQEFREDLRESRTLREEFLATFGEVTALEEEYSKTEAALAAAGDDADAMQDALNRMAELQTELEIAGADSVERRVDKIIGSMGFTPADADLPVSAFSGGWKMRIGLGKILLQDPQVLLLDEPTNHMDLESVEWLERYLIEQTSSLALAIVSHDREFLDRVCTKIVDTERGIATSYNGNYRNFLEQKAAKDEVRMRDFEKQQKQIKELKAEVNKLRPIESAAVAVRAKEKQIKEMEQGGPLHISKPYRDRKTFQFRFPPSPRCSPDVIELEGLAHGYGDSTLFSDIDLGIEFGDRIAILGPNGAGKSTLLRLIMGREEPREGTAKITASNAVVQHFEQDQANVLPLDKTVIQTMEHAAAGTDFVYEQLRALLGRFMFKADKVDDKLATLSGGEKARVALCRMLLTPSNVLLLDEPTNHLDIAAKEVLEEALRHYEGTVVMVSHDRYFVSQTANTILALEDGKLIVYDGDYRSYMEQNEEKVQSKVEARYIPGLTRIKSAPKIEVQPQEVVVKKKKNFGGKGGPSGNKMKGVKNAKRQGQTV
uniref:ABC transporter domain-containing protein n=1 Tax=Haptolina brevifila TaxID=156173 RepID=A0A7S2INT8_9EUKA|mmetsp:Transcript_69112/g.137071  ORF Transcript_69112/g.137071 Transcript_69112/m.137071 type:complete len:926 (+) Transcript_69112:89-2866(+)